MPESNIPKYHFLSGTDFHNWDENTTSPEVKQQQEQTKKYLKSKNFDAQSYINLLSGKYHEGFSDEDFGNALKLLSNSRHNTPENNDKVIETIIEDMKNPNRKDWTDQYRLREAIRSLKVSPKALQEVINHHKTVGYRAIDELPENPAFNREHLSSILSNPSILVNSEMINHPAMDQQLFDKMLNDKKFNYGKLPAGTLENKFLTPDHAKNILKHTPGKDFGSNERAVETLLNKIPEDSRHKFIKAKLGMSGGKLGPDEDPETSGWGNWAPGEHHDEHMSRLLAASNQLTPDEIEHIKRHGDFKSKFNLFQNPHIDPKHAIEMLSKWDQDDTQHGYDSDELKDALEKEHEDTKYDDFGEEAREEAQEEYPMDKFLENYSDNDLSEAYFDKPYDEWKKEWAAQNKDMTAPNPDYDPHLPEDDSNPKTIDYSNDPEDHPNWDAISNEADEAFKPAINQADTPESIYEAYDESLNDDISQKIHDLHKEDLENWSSSERLLPKHVIQAVQKPWEDENNVTPEQLKAGLNHPLKMVREAATKNKNMPPELISDVLNGDYDEDMKASVLRNAKHIQPEHFHKAIESEDPDLAAAALTNPKAGPGHITHALNKHPDNTNVVETALNHPLATEEHARQVLNNPSSDLGISSALDSRFNLSPEDLQQALVSHPESANSVMQHPNVTPELIQQGLTHESPKVRETAKLQQERRFPPMSETVNVKTGTHPLRILRDFIDQHGGTITKSKLKQLGVNTAPIDKLFKPNGTIESKDIQHYIDQTPAAQYNTSHSEWEGAQRHSTRPSKVFQLNYTQNQVKQMEQAGVLPTFHKIQQASFSSGHPVKPNTLGWVRYTGDPESGFHLDEVQSDFGQSMIKRVAQQAKEALRNGAISEDQAEDAVQRAKDYYPEEHVAKITDILFGKKHPSEVLHEGFKEYMRQKGFGNTPIHIWQPQSKAPISGQSTSIQIDPAQVPQLVEEAKAGKLDNDTKALIGWGQKNKILPSSHKDITEEHLNKLPEAYAAHVKAHQEANQTTEIPRIPVPLPVHMQEGYGAIPKKMKYQEGQYGELPTQENPNLKEQPTYKELIRKSEVDAQTKNKIAMTLKAIKDNSQVFEQLKSSNPNAYQALMEMVQSLVNIFKKKTGEDPDSLVHELEIKEQLQEQQPEQQASEQAPDQGKKPEQSGTPPQDERLHQKKVVYGIGAERNYDPQDRRIKQPDGSWQSFHGGLQDPNGGQNG